MQIVALHDHPELIGQTAELLNSHWKKSEEARLDLLKQSNDNFPINFVGFVERLFSTLSSLTLTRRRPACGGCSCGVDEDSGEQWHLPRIVVGVYNSERKRAGQADDELC